MPKPIYVHCHHGKHRSPTAVAAGCVAAGMIPPQSAPAILKLAGTAPKYGGLHRVAQTALPLSAAQLHAAHAPWRAVQQVSHTVRQMVLLDQLQDEFTAAERQHWSVHS